MLKGLDPLLHPDLLHTLRSMGHGDEIVICDANFPADTIAVHTVRGAVLRLDGVGAARAVRAVLSLMPLDSFVDVAAERMEVTDDAGDIPPVQGEVQDAVDEAEGKSTPMGSVERFAFYERAKNAYAVLATGEPRFYGCFIFKKGVIPPSHDSDPGGADHEQGI